MDSTEHTVLGKDAVQLILQPIRSCNTGCGEFEHLRVQDLGDNDDRVIEMSRTLFQLI